MEPKRCSGCGVVVLSDSVTCPSCRQPRMRALSDEERRVWTQVEPEGAELAGKAVAVRCEFR